MSMGSAIRLMRCMCVIAAITVGLLSVGCGDSATEPTPGDSDSDVIDRDADSLTDGDNDADGSADTEDADTEDGDIEGSDTYDDPDTDIEGDSPDIIDDDLLPDGDENPDGDIDEEFADSDAVDDEDALTETPDDVEDTDESIDEETVDHVDGDGPTITFTRFGNLHAIADYESYRYFAAEASDNSVVTFSIARALPEGVTLTNQDDGTAELMVATPQSTIGDAPYHQFYLLEATTDTGGYASELFGLWIHPVNPVENETCDSPITVKVGDVVWGFTGYGHDSFTDPPESCSSTLWYMENSGPDMVYRLAVEDSSIQRLQFSMVDLPYETGWRPENYIYFSQVCDNFADNCEKLDKFDYRSSDEEPDVLIYDVSSSASYFVVDTPGTGYFTTFFMEITPYQGEPGMICEDPILLPEGETLTGQTLEGHENIVTFYGAYTECSEAGDTPGRATGPQVVYTLEARAGIQYRVTVEPEDTSGDLDVYIYAPEYTLPYPLLSWDCKDYFSCRVLSNKKDEGKAEFFYFNIFEDPITDPEAPYYHQFIIGDASQTAPQGTFSISAMPEQCAVFYAFAEFPLSIGNYISVEAKYVSQLLINDFHITLELDHPAQEELRIELARPDSALNELWDNPIVLFDGEGSGQFGRKTFDVPEYQGHVVTDRKYKIKIYDTVPSNENQGQVLDFTVDINRNQCLNRPCNSYDDCPASNMRCQVYPKQCVLR